jgi:hypothetical protein
MLGARLGFASPGGEIARDSEMSDIFGPGGGFELHGGVRFARYFTGKLMIGGYGFAPGPDAEPANVEADNTTNAVSAGIGLQVGSPRGKLGGFGELGYLFVHEFRVVNDFRLPSCELTSTVRGPAFFAGGGASIPIGRSWNLTPFISYQWGTFEEVEVDTNCAGGHPLQGTRKIDKQRQEPHGMLFIGIGGEFLFGADKPLK